MSQKNTLYGNEIDLLGGNTGYVEMRTLETDELRLTGVVNVIDSSTVSDDADIYINGLTIVKEFEIVVNQDNYLTVLSTINSEYQYYIDGTIDIGSTTILVPGGGIHITGEGFTNSKLVSSEVGNIMFADAVGGSANIIIDNITIENTGAGSQVFNISDIDGTHRIEFSKIIFKDCVDLGYIDGFNHGDEFQVYRDGGTPTIEFRGSWPDGYHTRNNEIYGLINSSYSIFNCAVGQTFDSRFGSSSGLFTIPSSVSIYNVLEANIVTDGTFREDFTILKGGGTLFKAATIDEDNKKVNVHESIGTSNTYPGGYWSLTSEVATVLTLQGTYYKMAGTGANQQLVWFTAVVDNAITSDTTLEMAVVCNANLAFTGSANKELGVQIRLWDDSASGYVIISTSYGTIGAAGRAENISIMTPRIIMNKNDRIEAWIANLTSPADNITALIGTQIILNEV